MIGSGVELGVAQLRPQDATPGLFNWDPVLLPHTRKALANVRAGLGSAKINFIGHSALVFGAGTSGGETGGFPRVFPSVFTKLLSAKDAKLPTRRSSFWGATVAGRSGDTAAGIKAWDARLNPSANWTFLNSLGSASCLGGSFWINAVDTGNFGFTPEETWDTANIYFMQAAGTATATFNVDGGSASTFNTSAGSHTFPAPQVKTAGSVGTHTLNVGITGSVASGLFLAGVECYDSTKSEVRVRNWGWSGSQAGDWLQGAVDPWAVANGAINVVGSDLMFINLDINDEVASVPPATFQANVQAIINAGRAASSDVVLIRSQRPHLSGVNLNGLDVAYSAVLKTLALSNGCPLIDFGALFGSYENYSQYGWYFDDTHFNASGHTMQAAVLSDLVARL